MHMCLLSAAGGSSCKHLYIHKMANRITGCREEKWHDTLMATHVQTKPKLTTKSWVRADQATVAGSWAPLLSDVAASGKKLLVPTFSSRLDHYFGCCPTHVGFAETMQKTFSFCQDNARGLATKAMLTLAPDNQRGCRRSWLHLWD